MMYYVNPYQREKWHFLVGGRICIKKKKIFIWNLYYFTLNKFIISRIIVTF